MNTYSKIAFGSYLSFILLCGFMGVRYLFAGEIRPHHLEMIGVKSWDAVIPTYKVMLLMLMKGAGSGYLLTAVAMAVVLFGPFRKQESWSIWALVIIGLVQLGGRWMNVMLAGAINQKSVPIELLAIGFVLVLVAFCCSLMGKIKESGLEKKDTVEKLSLFSIICYSLVAMMCLITAAVYTTSSEIMSYHLNALGVSSWTEVDKGYQVILLTYMRGAGIGFLTTAVAIAFFLIALMRNYSHWLSIGLLLVALVQTSVVSYIVFYVRSNTPGHPPIIFLIIAMGLSIVGYLFPTKKFSTGKKQSCQL